MPAATIFHGGPVVTVDPRQPEVEALAIDANGTIIDVGTEKIVMERRGPATVVIDLKGKTLMPGFVEPHTHIILTAYTDMMTDLSSFDEGPKKIEWSIQKLRDALKDVPPNGWLTGSGVDPSRTDPFMASLNADELDKVQSGPIENQIPIFVMNQSGHFAYVNHRALQLAHITEKTEDPKGGVYERIPGTRIPNGVLSEAASYAPFQELIKASPSGAKFEKDLPGAVKRTYEQFARAGVTTATEITLGAVTNSIKTERELLEVRAADPSTPLRVRCYIYYATAVTEGGLPKKVEGTPMLKVIGVKFVTDGSTQGLTGSLQAPYHYPPLTENEGALNYDTAALLASAKICKDAGWQVAMHCNGDKATAQVLDIYTALLGGERPSANHRWRIEHLTVTENEQLKTIQSLGVTPSMTIGHVYFWGYAFEKQQILGSPRAQRIDPAKSLRNLGVRFSLNSDSPVTPVKPLRYISTAVTRLWQTEPQEALVGVNDDQRITVDEAIRAVTIDAAYQLFLEDDIGSLEVGKLADLVILEKNPRTTKPEEIMNIGVHSTYLSGVCKFTSDSK